MKDQYIQLKFQWKLPEGKKLSHIFKINDKEYYYGSEYEGSIYFLKIKEPTYIYHTYEWYGNTNWELSKILVLGE